MLQRKPANSLYTIKKALLAPRTAYKRRREKRADEFSRSLLELHHYGRPVYDFICASASNPDLLHDADLDHRSVVLDVGAYDGDWSENISRRFGSKIFAFEPNPRSFARLVPRLEDHPLVISFDYGLGAADEIATLALAGAGSSIYGHDVCYLSAQVQIRDVATVLEELKINRIDLLKVNIEGGEYDLFDRLIETGWLPRIRLVSVQFHEWHPKAYRRRRAIRRTLRKSHEEVWNYPWVWEFWRRAS
jgi:FkbM family methyltransferase